MAQIHKFHYIVSREKKVWNFVKGFLYVVSLSVLVFLGYLKAGNSVSSDKNTADPVKPQTTRENVDSLYYAIGKTIGK
ncbi:MAG: hypothetical protein JXR61_01640 [Prolixibacteraceae bacterium]|nr:hypothetical protein [Prolixibacteraceae bacterium]